jgi:hypothetical protein
VIYTCCMKVCMPLLLLLLRPKLAEEMQGNGKCLKHAITVCKYYHDAHELDCLE